MCEPKNRLQSNSKIDLEGQYLIGQSCDIPKLKTYSEEEAWNSLREFDLTLRKLRQNHLNHYKERFSYLRTFASNVHPKTFDILQDRITLLELIFNYTIWFQPNKEINELQTTYYTDFEAEEEA